jgi:hypothetical protein
MTMGELEASINWKKRLLTLLTENLKSTREKFD